MLIIRKDYSWETVVVFEENRPTPLLDQVGQPAHQYKIIHLVPEPDSVSTKAKPAPNNILSLVSEAWRLVENAGVNSQGHNILSANNEIWYLLARPKDGPFILHLAQGINPPAQGKLRLLYKSLIHP